MELDSKNSDIKKHRTVTKKVFLGLVAILILSVVLLLLTNFPKNQNRPETIQKPIISTSSSKPTSESNNQSDKDKWPSNPGSGGIVVKIYCVEKIDKTPCKGGVIVKDKDGKEVLRMESDDNGNLAHYLDPGDYTVETFLPVSGGCTGHALPPGSPPQSCTNSYPEKIVQPNKITVTAINYVQVTITYRSGLR